VSAERVIVAWATADEETFERSIPLLWTGRRLRKMGSLAELSVVFLDGLDRLSQDYRSALRDIGFRLIDATKALTDCERQYPSLKRFGTYGCYCFLRWPILEKVMPGARLMHFDGDMVFNHPLELLERDLSSFTFVLQGCPALAVVDSEWLDADRAELLRFAADIDAYVQMANREADGAELSAMTKWAGTRDEGIIAHDQDLISHLIHTDRLPQADPAAVARTSTALLFENPLYPHVYLQDQLPLRYERRGGVDYLSGVPVAFWHMQSNFCIYLITFEARPRFRRGARLANPLLTRTTDYYVARLKAKRGWIDSSRLALYRAFFERNDFSGVYNSRVFWADRAFG
jgi:hypothetical protein